MQTTLDRLIAVNAKILLVGPPGIGKTARISAAAETAGRQLIIMRASLSERVDFGGCLIPDHTSGTTKALPLELLHGLQHTTEPTYLFLDDLGQAPMDVQAACMRLFDPGFLSPSVLIGGATNRPGDKAGVMGLCEPLRSRFDVAFQIATPENGNAQSTDGGSMLSSWPEELSAWLDWMTEDGAPAELIAWHRASNGRTAYAWRPHADPSIRFPDFRSWRTVSQFWQAGIRDSLTLSAAIGKPAAMEFLAFASLASEIPSLDDIRKSPETAKVPSQPAPLYLVATMLAMGAERRDVKPVTRYLSRLPRTYGALLGRSLHKRMADKLAASPEWAAWLIDNADLFVS